MILESFWIYFLTLSLSPFSQETGTLSMPFEAFLSGVCINATMVYDAPMVTAIKSNKKSSSWAIVLGCFKIPPEEDCVRRAHFLNCATGDSVRQKPGVRT